jgi:hypothetical protein
MRYSGQYKMSMAHGFLLSSLQGLGPLFLSYLLIGSLLLLSLIVSWNLEDYGFELQGEKYLFQRSWSSLSSMVEEKNWEMGQHSQIVYWF